MAGLPLLSLGDYVLIYMFIGDFHAADEMTIVSSWRTISPFITYEIYRNGVFICQTILFHEFFSLIEQIFIIYSFPALTYVFSFSFAMCVLAYKKFVWNDVACELSFSNNQLNFHMPSKKAVFRLWSRPIINFKKTIKTRNKNRIL